MARTVARVIVDALDELGVRHVFGVVGDALNPLTDAIRTTDGLEWVGCRHEEAAAVRRRRAQSQLTGTLGVCMGTVGPGSVHLLNGLYDAAKSRTPGPGASAARCRSPRLGSDYFQEVDNDAALPRRRRLPRHRHLPGPAAAAARVGRTQRAVTPRRSGRPHRARRPGRPGAARRPAGALRRSTAPCTRPDDPAAAPRPPSCSTAAARVTLLVGAARATARDEVLALADRLAAPMVLTLKAKEGFEGTTTPSRWARPA